MREHFCGDRFFALERFADLASSGIFSSLAALQNLGSLAGFSAARFAEMHNVGGRRSSSNACAPICRCGQPYNQTRPND